MTRTIRTGSHVEVRGNAAAASADDAIGWFEICASFFIASGLRKLSHEAVRMIAANIAGLSPGAGATKLRCCGCERGRRRDAGSNDIRQVHWLACVDVLDHMKDDGIGERIDARPWVS